MKKLLFTICLLATTLAVSAQGYNSLSVSYTPSTLGGGEVEEFMGEDKYNFNGFSLEYTRGFAITNNIPLFVEAGLGFQFLNWNDKEELEGDYSFKGVINATSLYIPANVGYKFTITDNISVMPYLGLNLRFNLTSKYKLGICEDGKWMDDVEELGMEENPVVLNMFSEDDLGDYTMKRFLVGWQIGAKAQFSNYTVGVSYGTTLGDVFNKLDSRFGITTISVGYTF